MFTVFCERFKVMMYNQVSRCLRRLVVTMSVCVLYSLKQGLSYSYILKVIKLTPKFPCYLQTPCISLLRTLISSSRVLVELLPWRGGALKRYKYPKISLSAFNLLQTDIGGDDLTATGDGDKDTCKVETDL